MGFFFDSLNLSRSFFVVENLKNHQIAPFYLCLKTFFVGAQLRSLLTSLPMALKRRHAFGNSNRLVVFLPPPW